MIYFITVNYYSGHLIGNLLKSIETRLTIPYQCIIVNNSPDDPSVYNLVENKKSHLSVPLILEAGKNVGFGAGCNLGIHWVYQQDPQAIIWIINPDTLFQDASLEKVPAFFEAHPEVSILGTRVYDQTGKIWFSGGQYIPKTGTLLDKNLWANHSENNSNVAYVPCDWVTGCSLLINLRKFQDCPLFDPEYFLYYEDFDFCRRYAEQGHLIAVTHEIAVVHYASEITNQNFYQKYKYSTYSYLLMTDRYANKLVFWLRLGRLIVNAIGLLGGNRPVALGKLDGILSYLRRSR